MAVHTADNLGKTNYKNSFDNTTIPNSKFCQECVSHHSATVVMTFPINQLLLSVPPIQLVLF